MLEFLKAPFLVLHFPCCTLMTFLILSVILLFMLIILHCILSVIRHLICGNNLNWLLNFYLIYKTLWIRARSGLLISMLGKLNWFYLTSLIAQVLWMWKWMGLFSRKNQMSNVRFQMSDLKIYHFCFKTEWNFLHLLFQIFKSVLWLMEWVSVSYVW